jgi:hypothetical protein
MKKLVRTISALALLLGAAGLALVSLRVGETPQIRISPSGKAIGMRGSVVVTATAGGRGLAGLRVEVEQKGRTTVVARVAHEPLAPWAFRGERRTKDELQADVGRSAVPDLASGEAIVRVVAERAPTFLRHPDPVVSEIRLPVRLAPPVLSLLSSQHYVAQGGSGVVVYKVGEGAVRDGVRAGSWFFDGKPLPGASGGERFALFGVPWDLADDKSIRLVAEDEAGNASEVAFVDQYFPKPPATDRIQLQDEFLNRVVPEIMAHSPGLADRGNALDNYLQINRELRKKNAG